MESIPRGAAAAALAVVGTASAIPIPLAQLDFAGLVNVFEIDGGDAPPALRTLAAVGGALTLAVIGTALTGAVLALVEARAAQWLLAGAAVAGLLTALPLWLPAGILLGAAAVVAGGARAPTSSPAPV